MFRQLAIAHELNGLSAVDAADAVLGNYHGNQHCDFLDNFWNQPRSPLRSWGPNASLPHLRALGRPAAYLPLPIPRVPPHLRVSWRQIIYAFMLENTKLFEIFAQVLREYAHGEKLPRPTPEMQSWLAASEALFFTHPDRGRALTSDLRPEAGAIRRNAYFRLLGMDLIHAPTEKIAAHYVKPPANNRDFKSLFRSLLFESWRAYTNRNNGVGNNDADDEAILTLVRRIRELMESRRQNGVLGREEFEAVAIASWFHLVVEFDTLVVRNLNAGASSPAERLQKIGELVGVTAHDKADSFFHLAEPCDRILTCIENRTIETAGVQVLYSQGGLLTADMQAAITHWSIATGDNIKEAVASARTGPQPARPAVGVT